MKAKHLFPLAVLVVASACTPSTPIPTQENQFVNIYKPKGDFFPGPSTKTLKESMWYDEWVPNDHCFVRGEDGIWHSYGITHPLTALENIHEGENQSFHAISPTTSFATSCKEGGWIDQAKVLTPAQREGEILPNHAPYVVQRDGVYYMVYGHSPIRLATSTDLHNWTPLGSVFEDDKGARDPNLYYEDGVYTVSYCTERKVAQRTSTDLKNWSDREVVFESHTFDPESPSIIKYKNMYYLFVCSWDGINHTNDVPGAYQYNTYVYAVKKLGDTFDDTKPLTVLNAHAPEIFQDEEGQWYISSAEYPTRGVNVDKLSWK